MSKPEELTYMQKNALYQKRWRDKQRDKIGNEKFKKDTNGYLQSWRDKKKKEQGYVKGAVENYVNYVPQQVIEKPMVELSERNKPERNKKNKIKQQRASLLNSKLSDASIQTYLSGVNIVHQYMTGEKLTGEWKQEVIKVLKNYKYNEEGLHQELSYITNENLLKIFKFLKEKYTDDNSFKTRVNNLTSFIGRLTGTQFINEYKNLSDLNIKLQELYKVDRNKNKITQEDYDKMQLIKYDDNEIAQNMKKLDDISKKVIYGIYLYVPRRLEIRTLVLINNRKNIEGNNNYLLLNKDGIPDKFLFSTYKTSKTYSTQEMDVPDKLKEVLLEYIAVKNMKNNDLLFHLIKQKNQFISASNFSTLVSKILSQVYGVKITNQNLRTAYATYYTGQAKSIGDKEKVAKNLSHDYMTNEQYVKTVIKETSSKRVRDSKK